MSLEAIQDQLQGLYDLQLAHRVTDFLVTDPTLARALGGSQDHGDEALLLRQTDDQTLDLSLFVDAAVLQRLAERCPAQAWDAAALQDWWLALEGVSHFLCVAWRAERDRSTTALELELQAEIDKFLLTASTLGRHHGAPSLRPLHDTLFRRTRLRDDLPPALQHRYRLANRLAARYCQQLQRRHRVWPLDDALLRELRRFYRFDGQAKARHIERLN